MAVSTFGEAWVDGWNGGQYDAVLAVPAELYDCARSDFRDAIDLACADIVGESRYRSLLITVRRPPYDPDWVAKVVEALDRRWVASERMDAAVLSQAGCD